MQASAKTSTADYDNGTRQPYFSIVAKNADASRKEEFLRIIDETLEKLVAEGLDQKRLQAGLNYYEFKYREADYGIFPAGLMYGLQVMDSWLYDRNQAVYPYRSGRYLPQPERKGGDRIF